MRIAIIEDDRDFVQILQECLEEDPDVKVAPVLGSEQETVEWLERGGLALVDCCLVDLILPKARGQVEVSSIHGLRLVQEIKQVHGFTGSVLVLTNSREFADGERALSAGCDGYICKHAPISQVPEMLAELRLALRGDLMLVSREMRHVFIREDLSMKEAKLMDMLACGQGWPQIARELGYKTPKAAANIGYRVFEKLIGERSRPLSSAQTKRDLALERWRARLRMPGSPPATPASVSNK